MAQLAETTPTRVGFVGAGRLGMPMVERLAAAGTDLLVHARRPETAAQLRGLGVAVTSELAETARDREVVLACVYDDAQLAEIAGPIAAALPEGGVLASHVTARVQTLREVSERFGAIGVVEAPVSGTAATIRTGELTVLLGGRPADRAQVATVVRAYANSVIETGELGTALATKLVNNLLLAANSQLVVEAVRLGEALGITQEALLVALESMSGGSRASHHAEQSGTLAAFEARIGPFLRKDVAICVEQAREQGVESGLLLDVIRRGPLRLS